MNIGQLLKEKQPDIYTQLDKKYKVKKSKLESKSTLSHNDIESLMKNRVYKRGKGGAIKQVK